MVIPPPSPPLTAGQLGLCPRSRRRLIHHVPKPPAVTRGQPGSPGSCSLGTLFPCHPPAAENCGWAPGQPSPERDHALATTPCAPREGPCRKGLPSGTGMGTGGTGGRATDSPSPTIGTQVGSGIQILLQRGWTRPCGVPSTFPWLDPPGCCSWLGWWGCAPPQVPSLPVRPDLHQGGCPKPSHGQMQPHHMMLVAGGGGRRGEEKQPPKGAKAGEGGHDAARLGVLS